MFWNVTFIYNAFIRTTDHCKVQTAFVSLSGVKLLSKGCGSPTYPMASISINHW